MDEGSITSGGRSTLTYVVALVPASQRKVVTTRLIARSVKRQPMTGGTNSAPRAAADGSARCCLFGARGLSSASARFFFRGSGLSKAGRTPSPLSLALSHRTRAPTCLLGFFFLAKVGITSARIPVQLYTHSHLVRDSHAVAVVDRSKCIGGMLSRCVCRRRPRSVVRRGKSTVAGGQ